MLLSVKDTHLLTDEGGEKREGMDSRHSAAIPADDSVEMLLASSRWGKRRGGTRERRQENTGTHVSLRSPLLPTPFCLLAPVV